MQSLQDFFLIFPARVASSLSAILSASVARIAITRRFLYPTRVNHAREGLQGRKTSALNVMGTDVLITTRFSAKRFPQLFRPAGSLIRVM
jgi:hypothetical protein